MGLRDHSAGRWAQVVLALLFLKDIIVVGGGCTWTEI